MPFLRVKVLAVLRRCLETVYILKLLYLKPNSHFLRGAARVLVLVVRGRRERQGPRAGALTRAALLTCAGVSHTVHAARVTRLRT